MTERERDIYIEVHSKNKILHYLEKENFNLQTQSLLCVLVLVKPTTYKPKDTMNLAYTNSPIKTHINSPTIS